MRWTLVAAALLACSAPRPQPAAQVEPSKRTLTFRLEADGGEAILSVDGAERLRSKDRGNTIALDLREGEHAIAVRGTPSQYGGMGLELQVTAGEPLVAFSCLLPCTAEKLIAFARTLQARRPRCGDVAMHNSAGTVVDGVVQLGFAVVVPTPTACQ